ncbi:MAG: winged helix-turn-helix domain-containing protein [Scytonema sp. CRU_2_7]|nr:winged helix-turn-helix domain-containing protein [Scytonema sp. CRU_2_7]
MKYAERQLRNSILINLGKLALGQKEKGAIVGLTQQSVSKIFKKASLGLPLSQKRLGAKPRLSTEQLMELPEFLSKGSESYDFTGDYWTQKRVKYVIEKEYSIIYEVKQVGRILKKIGWTSQKPQKKDAKQDIAKVETWKTETLPALKKKP